MPGARRISESAFLVNESRARGVAVSRDIYARLWVTPETGRLWEDFSREVYELDHVELALRNRFYLEALDSAARRHPSVVFVNLAAGFTSYPFLAEKPCPSIEVDFGRVSRFKRLKIEDWRAKGWVPQREIEFVACDLADERQLDALARRLRGAMSRAPSVVFLEGITYYLRREALLRIFGALRVLQPPGSVLALDFWTPEFEGHPVHARFRKFFAERFGHAETEYCFLDAGFLRAREGYEIVDLTDIVELEKRFSTETRLADPGAILPERYAVLERRERR
jgi:O-methyltransferase involved in polyketide biosynthesis